MPDITIQAEKAAEKQDLERAAQESDPTCALPASCNSYEADGQPLFIQSLG